MSSVCPCVYGAKCAGLHLRDKLTPEELQRYRHLKTIEDSKRLEKMLPAWCRPDPVPKPRVFVPNQPPRFPRYCRLAEHINESIRSRIFQRFARCGETETVQEYVARWNKLNDYVKS